MGAQSLPIYGIDVGGSKIELAAFDADLNELHRERVATPGADFEAFAAAVAGLVARADDRLGARGTVGLGLPGVVDATSGAQLSSNIPALNGRRVAAELAARLGRAVVQGNDCQCFALSEARGGAGAGWPSLYGVILGTGVGGGYCVGGQLQRGFNGLAGEWGHIGLPAAALLRHGLPLIDCPCGRVGCLERYLSGPGLSGLHRFVGGEGLEAELLVLRAAAGDALARRALDLHLDLLAEGLVGLVLALDPHGFVLGGGLSAMVHLYAELPLLMGKKLFAGVRVPEIRPPVFGASGGARGAALLALGAAA